MVAGCYSTKESADDEARVEKHEHFLSVEAVGKSFGEGLRRGAAQKPLPMVPMTVVGVQSLFRSNIEAEVEAVAIIA